MDFALRLFRLRFRPRHPCLSGGTAFSFADADRVGSGIRSSRLLVELLLSQTGVEEFGLLESSLRVVDGLPLPLRALHHACKRLATISAEFESGTGVAKRDEVTPRRGTLPKC